MGDTLGHYQLLTQVGSGGMGRVWAARQLGALQRLVAIKTALTDAAQTAEFERVFLDEARIASQIHHPHVCGVYELGEQDGVLYLVMEWSDGGTLLEVLKRQPEQRLEPTLAGSIVAKVCAGLHAAHELEDELGQPLNVVHRDVTPQNILLSSQGHVRLADFGVAKAQGQIHRPTETGEVKGKLNYMAPEQLTSKQMDRRVDIFALGCVLYECTVGRRPFQGDGALSTLYLILEEEVRSPCETLPGYPERLASIVLKALSKQADDRYQTAEEMQKDLEAWLISEGVQTGEGEISALVLSSLGDAIRARSELIDLAIERFDTDQPLEDTTEGAEPEVKDRLSETGAPGVSTGSRPRGGGRFNPLVWALGAGIAVTSGWVFWGQTENASPVVVLEPPTAVTQSLQRVRVTLQTFPEHARILIDDEPAGDAPFVAEVEPSERERVVRVMAEGYQDRVERLTFDRPQEWTIRLRPVPTAVPSATVPEPSEVPNQVDTVIRKPRPNHVSAVTQTQKAPRAEPAVTPAEGASKSGKTRMLDTENPF